VPELQHAYVELVVGEGHHDYIWKKLIFFIFIKCDAQLISDSIDFLVDFYKIFLVNGMAQCHFKVVVLGLSSEIKYFLV
jgi:hypothetical protein